MILGVMQGRLLPKYQGATKRTLGYWRDEFPATRRLGLGAWNSSSTATTTKNPG